MYRVGISIKEGKAISKNFDTKEKAEEYILNISDKQDIIMAIILNLETKEREYINFKKENQNEQLGK